MRIPQRALTWGVTALTALALALPACADHFVIGGHGGGLHIDIGLGVPSSTVRVVQETPADEAVVFRQWYADQVRALPGVYPETGERLSEIAQMVTAVADRSIAVVDEDDAIRNVYITGNAKIIFSQDNQVQVSAEPGAPTLPSLLRPGDLIVADGHLRAHGGLMAHRITVVGHVSGYGDTAAEQPAYGERCWGVVDRVNGEDGTLVIRVNDGRRSFVLDRDGVVWFGGKVQALNYLRPGDRVIVYGHHHFEAEHASAFRIVLLQPADVFPAGEEHCWADPDGAVVTEDGPYLEGDVEYISTGVVFDTVYIRTHDGHHEHVRFPHGMAFVDGHGQHVAPTGLHTGSPLRLRYSDVGGNHFTHRVEVK